MVKTLTIRTEVYDKLIAIKRPNESFSELFERLVEKQGSIEILKALRGSLEFKSTEEKNAFISGAITKRDEKRF
jgi:predicted CopG family antitoxin